MGTRVDHELGLVAIEFAIDKNMVSLDRELEAFISPDLKEFADGKRLALAKEEFLFLVPLLDVFLISITKLVIG